MHCNECNNEHTNPPSTVLGKLPLTPPRRNPSSCLAALAPPSLGRGANSTRGKQASPKVAVAVRGGFQRQMVIDSNDIGANQLYNVPLYVLDTIKDCSICMHVIADRVSHAVNKSTPRVQGISVQNLHFRVDQMHSLHVTSECSASPLSCSPA